MQTTVWFRPENKSHLRGVAIVAHGMNLKPSRMDDLAQVLRGEGYEVLRVAFSGHGARNEEYLEVTAGQWESDARRFHAEASARARELGVPLVLAAYSFSAVVFQALAAELPFARRVYLAPALSPKYWYRAVILFARSFPNFSYASLNSKDYRVHPRSGARPFLALEHFLRAWRSGPGYRDETPTLILIDPADELIDYRRSMSLADERPRWRVERVSVAGSTLPRRVHHLIVDRPSLGDAEWARMGEELRSFLSK